MDYRGTSKDETYGSKNRNQSHWLKAAWREEREYLARWLLARCATWIVHEYLSAFTSSWFLSLSFSLSHLSFFSSLRFFIFFFLLLLLLPRICSSPSEGPPCARSCCCYLYPWPMHQTDTQWRIVSRKFVRERLLRRAVKRCASAELVSPSKPWRVVQPVENNTSAGIVSSLIPRLGERTGRRETRSILSA